MKISDGVFRDAYEDMLKDAIEVEVEDMKLISDEPVPNGTYILVPIPGVVNDD